MKIEATDRNAIFENFPTLSSAVQAWQEQTYCLENVLFKAGESVWLDDDDDAPTELSAEMAERLNKETEEEFRALKDVFTQETHLSRPEDTLIVEMAAKSFEDFTANIGRSFSQLAEAMHWEEFALISDCRRPILVQDNDFPSVRKAEDRLLHFGFTKTDTNGFVADTEGLSAILGNLFWIARCNASAPGILISPRASATVAMLCKYGNFHVDFYKMEEKARFESELPQSGLKVEKDGICHERFSEEGAISGRALF